MVIWVHSPQAMRYILFAPLATCGLFAQSDHLLSPSVGFKLGSPLNDPSSRTSLFSSYTQGRWTGGPTVELNLSHGFSVEFDALYRNYRTNSSYSFRSGPDLNPYIVENLAKANVWDLPLLLKKRFTVGSLRPFISAGYQWSNERSTTSFSYICAGPQGSCSTPGYPVLGFGQTKSSTLVEGPVAGAGIEFKTRYGRISPEVRFSRPTDAYPRDNRLTGLVGFTWGKK
jgi:hypothetical protein